MFLQLDVIKEAMILSLFKILYAACCHDNN